VRHRPTFGLITNFF